jgi:hypothetical protein
MTFYIYAKYISPMFKDFFIKSNTNDVQDCLDLFRKKDNLISIYRKIIKNLFRYSDEELSCSVNEGNKYNDWCNDVILYYCCRYLLYNKPIPIFRIESDNTIESENKEDNFSS